MDSQTQLFESISRTMLPADIVIQNDSGVDLKLVHTDACDNGDTSAYKGKANYWKSPPPNASTSIPMGQTKNVGTMDTVNWWDSPSWIFIEYGNQSKTRIQIFVDMQGPGIQPSKGIWVQVGPYRDANVGATTEGSPMPGGSRPELVVYDLHKSPHWEVVVHIPPPEDWTYLAQPAAPPPENTGETVLSIINAAVSTLITVCFVIPPAAEIGVALEAMSMAGRAAVALTAAQGVLGVVTAPDHSKEPTVSVFGATDAFTQAVLAQKAWTENELRHLMDLKQSGFRHKDDNGGIDMRLRYVAESVRKQLDSGLAVTFDKEMTAQTKQCLEFFDEITSPKSDFQAALTRCLDLAPAADAAGAPPDKIKLGLGMAGLSMTLTAFSNAYALSSFVRAAENAKELEEKLGLSKFDADHVYEYMMQLIDLMEGFELLKAATAQRQSLVTYGSEEIDVLEPAATHGGFISKTYSQLVVKDGGLTKAMWGPCTVVDADAQMDHLGLTTIGLDHQPATFHGPPRVWHAKSHYDAKGARDSFMYKTFSGYSKMIGDNVAADVKVARDDPIAELKGALIPYLADLMVPLSPFKPAMEVSIKLSAAPPGVEKLDLNLVQYGFCYCNVRGVLSEIYWHPPSQLSIVLDGNDKSVSSGAFVVIPLDPNNEQARQLAEKARPIKEKAQKLPDVAVSSTAKVQPLDPLPTFVSTFRMVYRRFWLSTDQVQPNVEPKLVKKLGNLQKDGFEDSWDPKALVASV